MPPLQVVLSFVGIIIILFGAYYATYYISLKASGKNSKRGRSGNRSICLLERFAISKDKSFCIVEIAGKIYIIGVTNQSMSVLDTLDAEEFAEYRAESNDMAAWGAAPGGPFGGKLVNRLASFMASRMGNTHGMSGSRDTKNTEFTASMKTAREKNTSGHTDREKAARADSSEEEPWAR